MIITIILILILMIRITMIIVKDATNVAKYNAKVSLEVHLEWDRYKVAPCCQ